MARDAIQEAKEREEEEKAAIEAAHLRARGEEERQDREKRERIKVDFEEATHSLAQIRLNPQTPSPEEASVAESHALKNHSNVESCVDVSAEPCEPDGCGGSGDFDASVLKAFENERLRCEKAGLPGGVGNAEVLFRNLKGVVDGSLLNELIRTMESQIRSSFDPTVDDDGEDVTGLSYIDESDLIAALHRGSQLERKSDVRLGSSIPRGVIKSHWGQRAVLEAIVVASVTQVQALYRGRP